MPVFPYQTHPCWSKQRENLWERIHLPVASRCNVKCIFCTQQPSSSCHFPTPGSASRIMSVDEAVKRCMCEFMKRPFLKIVAVSGPGEPLFNEQTFDLLKRIRQLKPYSEFCLSTNGLELVDRLPELRSLSFKTLTVSMHAIQPETAEKIYEWCILDGKREKENFGHKVIQRQLEGIKQASKQGIHVKVNTVLIPEINLSEIAELANHISQVGASIQNLMPLVLPKNGFLYRAPTIGELVRARKIAAEYIPQFEYCRLCRSDVVGIPGRDCILD